MEGGRLANPIPGVVRTSLGEPLRFCPSCWKDRPVQGGAWVIKRGVRRFKCKSCIAKELPGQRAA